MSHACQCSCGAADPIDVLKSEHRVIERVLDATEQMLDAGRIEKPFFTGVIDFVRNFADGCHHLKEEEQLFPMLEQAGVPSRNGPIGCMLHEHEMGRSLVRAVEKNLDEAVAGRSTAVDAVRAAARDYIDLLRQHIMKEDQVLFEMARRVLSDEDRHALKRAYKQIEHSPAAEGKHERYLRLADDLCRTAGTWTPQPV